MQLQNFTLTAGTDRVLSMKAKTPSGAVLSLTGASITWRLSRALGGGVVLSKSGTVVSAALGTFTVSLSDADTASLANGNYVHEALITIGSTQYSAVQGAVRVSGSNSVSSSSDGGFADDEDQNVLTTDQVYYVRTDGADTNDGLTDTAGGAFRTIQAAVDAYSRLDLAGYTCTIRVADGTYTAGAVIRDNPKGATAALPLQIIGNTSTPASCIISPTSANCFKAETGGQMYVNGFTLQTTTSGRGLQATTNGYIAFGTAMAFGACATYHIEATIGGNVISLGNYTISGSSGAHLHCTSNGHILLQSGTVTITGTPAFSSYFVGVNGAYVQTGTVVWSGSATGKRFLVHDNGTIYTGQSFTQTYFPGDTVGEIYGGGVVDDITDVWRIVGKGSVASSITGTTNETVLATVTIPGGSIGPNGIIRIYSLWSNTNDASGKTARIRLNGLGTQAIMGSNLSTSGVYADFRQVHNVNSQSSQKVMQFTYLGGLGASTTATTAAIDTSASISLVFTGQLTDSADTISIEAYTVEVMYAA